MNVGTAPLSAATASLNIADQLADVAQRYPDKAAVVWPNRAAKSADDKWAQITFRELDEEADRLARGLSAAGLKSGTRTILMVRPGREFFALTFALFRLGAVPVLIDPGMGRRDLVKCLAEVRAEAFIGIPLAHLLRVLHRGEFRSIKLNVTVGRRWLWGGLRLRDVRVDGGERFVTVQRPAEAPAAILFTSGSTGPAKGVVYTHRIFDAQVKYLNSHYGYGRDAVDLASFPLFALFDTALGMTAVIPDMDPTRPGSADPYKICGAIAEHGCTQMFGSPALLKQLARHGEATGAKLPTIKRVMTAGAPVQPRLLESLHRMLNDEARIHTPYGATECLPVADTSSVEILRETREATDRGAGTCVGRPLPQIRVRIIEISDEPIADWSGTHEVVSGEIGEIVVTGPVVTHEYFGREKATALAKIRDVDGTIWHRMGDVGYQDEQGRLWFCGRKAHRVTAESGTMFTVPCEAIFNTHPRVYRTALVGVGPFGRQKPVLCVELEGGLAEQDTRAIETELRERGAAHEHTRPIDTFLFLEAFPVDVRHNAKIFREKLAVMAAGRLGD